MVSPSPSLVKTTDVGPVEVITVATAGGTVSTRAAPQIAATFADLEMDDGSTDMEHPFGYGPG